ncbi:MAG: protein phosphatase 2C domain-containing protein [Burkholderiales bacterium]|nr:protein phosphatase 2C domain-containing protein [Burkholderiales bacterium]
MNFVVYQASRRGGRAVNEDRVAYAYTPEALFMVVADGMGGHSHGQVAAQLLVQTMVSLFQQRAVPRLPNMQAFLLDGIYAAHDAINEYALRNKLNDPPRTTCVAAVVQGGVACWAHVGDSRLYHFDKRRLLERTRDHSAVQQLVDEGLLSDEQMRMHPDRNKLYNCVGGYALPDIELAQPVTLQEGDVLLLCSDGIWGEIKDREMLATLRAYPLERAIRHIMDHAEFRGGRYSDNLSIVAMRYGEERFDDNELVLGDDLGLDGFTTQLKRLSLRVDESLQDKDIDQAVAEIQAALAKYGLDKSTP